MEIVANIDNRVLHIQLSGELDEYSATYSRKKLDEIFSLTGYTKVIIDMSNLTFMDSTGIGVLIGRYKKIKSENKQIYIANPNKQIEKIFKMSGIYEIMPKIS